MRIKVGIFTRTSNINLPFSHNHIVQGLIYSLMEVSLRRKVHEEGFKYEKRRFKLFTFSRLQGRYEKRSSEFNFISPVKLIIASSQNDILQSITENLVKNDRFSIGRNEVFIESINVLPKPDFSGKITTRCFLPLPAIAL